MRVSPRVLRNLLLISLAWLVFAGCSGSSQPTPNPDVSLVPALADVPFPLAAELEAPRGVSGVFLQPIDASESYKETDNTAEDDTKRVFTAGPGEIAWAIYKFEGLTDWLDLTNLGMEFDELPEKYYLGLSDFTTKQWRWYERGTSSGGEDALDSMSVPEFFNCVSPAGNCYAVALFHDSAGGTLQQALLAWSSDTNGPETYFEADPDKGNANLQVSFDASGTTDADGVGISLYEWDWEGDGIFDESGPASTVQHIYTQVGDYHPLVRATDTDDGLTDTAQLEIHVQGWQHSFGGIGKENIEAVTYQGENIYASGLAIVSDEEESNYEGLLISYDSAGNPRWQKTWGGGLGADGFQACASVYGNGIVAVGQTENFGSTETGIYVVRFAANGSVMWARHWDTPGTDYAAGVAVDLEGNIVVVGHTNGFDVDIVADGLVLKYDPSGTLIWEKGLINTGQTTCRDVDVSLGGDIYVAADSTSYNPNCAIVFHLDPDGELVKESPLDVGNITKISGIAVTLFGEVFITGNAHVPDEALLVAGLNSSGDFVWANAGDYADAAFGQDITVRYGQFAQITAILVGGYAYYEEPYQNIGVLAEYEFDGGYTSSVTWTADSHLSFRDLSAGRYGAILLAGNGELAEAVRASVNSPPLIFQNVNTQLGTAAVQDVSSAGKSITGNLRDLDGVLDTGSGDQDTWVGSFVPEDL